MKDSKGKKESGIGFWAKAIATTLVILILAFGFGAFCYTKTDIKSMVPQYIQKEYDFQKESFYGRDIFSISPKKENDSKKVIIYIHGGSYVGELTLEHWKFASQLVDRTGYRVIMPDYPLAPKHTYQDVFAIIEPFYEKMLREIGAENIILMGDSAGGGLSLALCEEMGTKGFAQPSKLILISPWLDTRMENPEIDNVAEKDPILNKVTLKIAANIYAGEEGKQSYLVNPIDGPLENLGNIIIYTGTYDIFNPDTRLFVEKAKQKGVYITLKETEKATHVWILRNGEKTEEYMAKEDFEDLIHELKK